MNQINTASVKKLSPAAARLLLAWLCSGFGDTFDDVVRRSGIHSYQTVLDARQQLREMGFVTLINGKEYASLSRLPDKERRTLEL